MRLRHDRGFTLVEVMMAVLMLAFGLLILAQSAGGVTRMLRDGRLRTRATALATSRLEALRRQSLATTPNCSALSNGAASLPDGMTESWTVSAGSFKRDVAVTVAYSQGTGAKSVLIRTTLLCQ